MVRCDRDRRHRAIGGAAAYLARSAVVLGGGESIENVEVLSVKTKIHQLPDGKPANARQRGLAPVAHSGGVQDIASRSMAARAAAPSRALRAPHPFSPERQARSYRQSDVLIARQAALSRWSDKPARAIRKVSFKKRFGIDVDCYVLDEEQQTAVISQRGMGEPTPADVRFSRRAWFEHGIPQQALCSLADRAPTDGVVIATPRSSVFEKLPSCPQGKRPTSATDERRIYERVSAESYSGRQAPHDWKSEGLLQLYQEMKSPPRRRLAARSVGR
jgi:hypothetical protein